MEPADISPLRCPSPAPLDGVGHPEVESKEEELRGFVQLSVGVSCRPPGSADSPESTSCLRQPLPIKPATHQSGCGLNLPVKQSQPTFSMNLASGWNETDMEHRALKAESAVRLIDDYRSTDTCVASAANARLQREEMGFADFTVFTEQTVHHWCCGFTPSGNPETSNGRLGQRNPSNSPLERPRSPGQVALGDSDPHCSSKAKDCTMIGHWQEGDAAVAQPHQDQQQPQETAATLVFPPAKDHVEKGESEESDPTPEVREEGGEESAEQDEPGRHRSGNIGAATWPQAKAEEDPRRSDSSATQENSATSGPLRSRSAPRYLGPGARSTSRRCRADSGNAPTERQLRRLLRSSPRRTTERIYGRSSRTGRKRKASRLGPESEPAPSPLKTRTRLPAVRRHFPAVCTSFSWLISWRQGARVLPQSWRCSASPLCLMSNAPLSVRTARSNRARGSRRGCGGCARTFTVQSASGSSGEAPTPAGLCSGASAWTQRTSVR
ncbi:hypothetical protein fugu_012504 [Takifugu bimaculatus]|uniref:Uncharacterized protein n=1 Tax=Takifugu bimaculatus TaxID=433685 RepID=A0A4Z2C5J4_9TELE|nr:hypothetical protein fugu_012504 [Takifugu bimaculatus]